MNLGVVAIAVVFFVAFYIGLNLGLHGVLDSSSALPPRATPSQHEGAADPSLSHESAGGVAMAAAAGELSDRHFRPHLDAVVQTAAPTRAPTRAPTQAPSAPRPRNVSEQLQALQNSEAVLTVMATKGYDKALAKRPIGSYLRSGGALPIVLLTCNRPEMLQKTLRDLLAVRGVRKQDVLVMQVHIRDLLPLVNV